jgi:glutamine synthetase
MNSLLSEATFAEYVWIDAKLNLRSKTKVLKSTRVRLEDLPEWNFDGSSTGQAEGNFSDVFIRPKKIYSDPFLKANHILVLCECFQNEQTPDKFNNRWKLVEAMKSYNHLKPWCGIEQEYVLFDRHTKMPLGWKEYNNPGIGPQGPYYCGVGGDRAFGRKIAQEHLKKCVEAGIHIFGMNGEVMASQWEYQIGTSDPLTVADDLWMARYILNRITEDFDCYVDLHPKPFLGDGNWNGSGCHTNYSTQSMREEGGLKIMEIACKEIEANHAHDIKLYGDHNEMRLTGKHETQGMDKFSWGVGDRGASIRISKEVAKKGKGYFEDRRPASNIDPYVVLTLLTNNVGKALNKL